MATDTTWKVKESACMLANVYGSETYDARRYPAGWDASAFEDKYRDYAEEVEEPKGRQRARRDSRRLLASIWQKQKKTDSWGGGCVTISGSENKEARKAV